MSRLRITAPALAARRDRRTLLSALLIAAYGFACLIGVSVGLMQGSGRQATLVVVTPRDLTPGTPGTPGVGETPGGTAPPFGTQAFGTPAFGTPAGTAAPGGATVYPGPSGNVSSPPGVVTTPIPPVQGTPLPPPATPLPFPTAGATPTFAPPPPIVTTTAPAAEGTPTPATSPYPGGGGTPGQSPTAPIGGAGSPTPSPAATNVTGFSVVSAGSYLDATGLLTVMGEVRNSSGNAASEVVIRYKLYDASNFPLGEETAYIVVPPLLDGETGPFWNAFRPGEGFDHTGDFSVSEVEAAPPAEPIQLKLLSSDTREDGSRLIISGSIQNTGTVTLFNVSVIALVFDPAGQPRRWADGDPDRTTLNPQQQATFQLSADRLTPRGEVHIYLAGTP
jgi:hypothetical protein